jgi:hypothetical protein
MTPPTIIFLKQYEAISIKYAGVKSTKKLLYALHNNVNIPLEYIIAVAAANDYTQLFCLLEYNITISKKNITAFAGFKCYPVIQGMMAAFDEITKFNKLYPPNKMKYKGYNALTDQDYQNALDADY